jgi:ABC-type oligopeptide transport system substrate-binding subunit/class 3 adenylate cyclase
MLQDAAPRGLQEKMRAAQSQIDGERKPVTILFADIVGSTTIAESLDPEEWREIVAGAHQRVGEAIYRYEGTIAQLLGDGLLAFFGAPITHEDDPIRAVHAALDIQDAIVEYEHELESIVDHFQMRIGINSGTVVIGDIGTDLHVEYLAIGDAVNIAARLQSSAQPGKVLLSENSARLVSPVFELQDLGEIELKGKVESLSVFEVVKPKVEAESSRGIEGLQSPLIGREKEMLELQSAISSLAQGRGQIVALMGEAGIGKSRLLEEIRAFAVETLKNETGDSQPSSIRWLEGRSLSYGAGLSYWPITQLLLADLGLSDGDPEIRIKAALRRRIEELFGETTSEILPILFHLLGVKQREDDYSLIKNLDSETLKHQLLISLTKYFQRLAEENPSVLIFEDVHWADPSTLEALERILPLTDHVPLMVLMVMRINRDHGSWGMKMKAESDFAHRFSEIELKRLSSTESDELVDNILEVADLPTRIRGLIMARSDGNPFYLEEIIRNMIDDGIIIHEENAWRATQDITEVTIPETLHGVLLARIDRLEEDVRSTLQIASVIGKSFLYRLLESISQAELQLETHITKLQRADLVREKSRWPELEYIFKHSLTQEAAYDSLLIERRKKFHLQVGEAMEELFPDRLEEFYGLLAHHFEAAGVTEKALDYLLHAGDKARLEDALHEAIDYYQRALRITDETSNPSLAARTWLKLGLIHQMMFHFDEAREANEAAFTLQQSVASQISEEFVTQHVRDTSHLLTFAWHLLPATFDPGKAQWTHEHFILNNIFAGLAELDSESNVVPHISRSWEVLEGGKRYIFHLREDARWTDGTTITAHDFEWAWKRNLAPDTNSHTARFLDDVLDARSYRLGENPDPDSVGVRALNDTTLEVILERPTAYFIYVVTNTVSFPLPRIAIEKYGDAWWTPDNIVSNGAFTLEYFNEESIELKRNFSYFGEFPGNIDGVKSWFVQNFPASLSEYTAGRSNVVWDFASSKIPPDILPDEVRYPPYKLGTRLIAFNPLRPPMDDIRVRRAVAHGLDREKLMETWGFPLRTIPRGGLLPQGLAGHSPELGYEHDIEKARRLLAEAGYPNGKGFPVLNVTHYPAGKKAISEYKRQLKEGLGIETSFERVKELEPIEGSVGHLMSMGWAADYPDPDNFLHKSSIYLSLRQTGWEDSRYEKVINKAATITDRTQRLALYRQADKMLVNDEILVYPISYHGEASVVDLAKPWITNLHRDNLGNVRFRDITFEKEHEGLS